MGKKNLCRVKQWLKTLNYSYFITGVSKLHWYAATVRTWKKNVKVEFISVPSLLPTPHHYFIIIYLSTSKRQRKKPAEHRLALKGN